MKNYLIVMMVFIASCGCIKPGKPKQELGILADKTYKPGSLDVSYGVTTGGHVAVTTSGESEGYYCSFYCFRHGEMFTINSELLFRSLHVDDTVKISYNRCRRHTVNLKIL